MRGLPGITVDSGTRIRVVPIGGWRDTARAMSRENVELAKRGIELWNRGDMDALRERYHPKAVMHHPAGWPEPGPSVGRDAIFDQFHRLREDAKTDQLEMTILADAGDWIVWEYRWSAIGLESGLPMELIGGQATRYSAGKIVEVRFYADRNEALEAVGLSE
jgi:ketosteroid isomerase-like protein